MAHTNRRRAMRRAISEHLALPDVEARLGVVRLVVPVLGLELLTEELERCS